MIDKILNKVQLYYAARWVANSAIKEYDVKKCGAGITIQLLSTMAYGFVLYVQDSAYTRITIFAIDTKEKNIDSALKLLDKELDKEIAEFKKENEAVYTAKFRFLKTLEGDTDPAATVKPLT